MAAAKNEGWMDKLSGFVSRHPYATAAGAVCVVGAIWLAREVMAPEAVFLDDGDDETASTSGSVGDGAKARRMDEIVKAVHAAQLEGRFTKKQLTTLYKEWHAEFGGKPLNITQFSAVFKRLGVTDEQVIRSSFDAWDVDGSGTLDFSEMLNVLAITSTGSKEDKLQLMFQAFDLNKDGVITPKELAGFYRSLLVSLGVHKTDQQIDQLVAQLFGMLDANHDGCLTFEEFAEAGRSHHFLLEEDVFGAFDRLMMNSFDTLLG